MSTAKNFTQSEEDCIPVLSATEASRAFAEMLERVYFQQQSYRIMRHGIVLAVIRPPSPHGTNAMLTKGFRIDDTRKSKRKAGKSHKPA